MNTSMWADVSKLFVFETGGNICHCEGVLVLPSPIYYLFLFSYLPKGECLLTKDTIRRGYLHR